jgi:hypothetical protein
MNTLLWILAVVAVLTPIVVVAFLLAPGLQSNRLLSDQHFIEVGKWAAGLKAAARSQG